MTAPAGHADPFDDILNLEDQFYAEGYEQGTRDGIQAGKIEGRSVGLAKGFDKFLESGRLYGKALVWGNRLQLSQPSATAATATSLGSSTSATQGAQTPARKTVAPCLLPPIANNNARIQKNVITVGALVEPDTLATENSDEAVNDFDDRVKRAQGKAKVVERAIGEHAHEPRGSTPA